MKQHKFERMDKGVKRGAHNADRTTISGKTIKARDPSGKALAIIKPEQREDIVAGVIQRYVHGESMQDLCAEFSVSRGTLYNWMLGELGPAHYGELVTQMLVQRCRTADELLETAQDPLNIARAREMARFARMDLERRRPHLYGQKQEVKHTLPQGPLLSITLSQPSSGNEGAHNTITIDAQPVDSNDV